MATRNAKSSMPPRFTGRYPTSGTGRWAVSTVPDESIICTWTTNLALATDAVARGRDARSLNRAVTGVEAGDDRTPCCAPSGGEVNTRWVVNAAGLGADISTRRSATTVSTSRRGAASCWSTTSSPARWSTNRAAGAHRRGKGVLVSPPSTAT